MKQHRGFTIIEIIIFVMVISTAMTGLFLLLSTVGRHSNAPLIRERALTIATSYMDAILARRWHEESPVGGGCIRTIDDATDNCAIYCNKIPLAQCANNSCTQNSEEPPDKCVPKSYASGVGGRGGDETGLGNMLQWDDIDDFTTVTEDHSYPRPFSGGDAIAGYEGYQVDINVTEASIEKWHGIDSRDVRRVRVKVTSPSGETVTLVTYRVNF